MNPSNLRMGIYRHYKGPLYQTFGLAHDANAEDLYVPDGAGGFRPLGERKVAVYIGLQFDGAHPGPAMAVRTLEDFVDARVCTERDCEFYGKTEGWDNSRRDQVHLRHPSFSVVPDMHLLRRRFNYLGEERTRTMIRDYA